MEIVWRTAAKSMLGRTAGLLPACLPRCLAPSLATLPGLVELAVAFGEDFLIAARELVFGRDVADGGVQADIVVIGDVAFDDAAGRRGTTASACGCNRP